MLSNRSSVRWIARGFVLDCNAPVTIIIYSVIDCQLMRSIKSETSKTGPAKTGPAGPLATAMRCQLNEIVEPE